MKKVTLIIFILTIACLAQENQPAAPDTAAQEQPVVTGQQSPAQNSQDPMKLFLDNIEVTGQLEKPQAVFFIPGTNPGIDDIQIDRSFFESIFRPVEKKNLITPNLPPEPVKESNNGIPW